MYKEFRLVKGSILGRLDENKTKVVYSGAPRARGQSPIAKVIYPSQKIW